MAGRPVDHQRRAELLDAVVDYTVEHGFSDLSWRPVAAALGVSTTTLVHRFGAKEQLLEAILGRLRERIFVATGDSLGGQPDVATAARSVWNRSSDPQREPEFRLFFAVYGRALQAPQQFTGFLDQVVARWMAALVEAQGPDADPVTALRTATLVIATIRGLLLDLLATGDRERVQDAAESFLASLESPGAVNSLPGVGASRMMAGMATTRRADMFTADGKPSDDDPRENGPRLGDERATLAESLRCQRLTLEMKCAGLDAEAMARRSVSPSTMSLLGLVRHLAEMERATFRVMMAGQDAPRLFCSETDRDGDFNGAVPDPRVVAEAWETWRAEVEFATRFVAGAPGLDITGDDPLNQHGSSGGAMSLREALLGMIEEYARHMGHADLLRERIDGRIGQ